MERLDSLFDAVRGVRVSLPDKRRGHNRHYTMADIGMAAFSVFFMQCPSFLAHQRVLLDGQGRSNSQTLVEITEIPSDNHIRDMPEVGRALRRQGDRDRRRRRRRCDHERGPADRAGPVFERLWEETGCRAVVENLASARKHDFALERAVFLTVLHRLVSGGSDRAADFWKQDYRIEGAEELDLHHLDRAMAWLGEGMAFDQQDGATPYAPRCLKDVVEEDLFARRRTLFNTLDLVFMDTTSLSFEGAGGQTSTR